MSVGDSLILAAQVAPTLRRLLAVSRVARAQSYPARPVRIIVGFPAGGSVDLIARLTGQWLSERLGQPFIVENRPGAGTSIAGEAVVCSPPDGHTLLVVGASNYINTTFYERLSCNFICDIAPVASVFRSSFVLQVHPAVPAKTIPELIAHAKANPGKLTMGSPGNGTTPHVAGELFKMMTGIKMVHEPYRGVGPAIIDLLAGQVQVLFAGAPESIEHIRAGKLHPLAVTTTTRSDALPDVSTVGEFVPGYEASAVVGVGAPKNTPAEIIDKLNNEAVAKSKPRFAKLGAWVLAGSPADFGKLIADETEKWGKG